MWIWVIEGLALLAILGLMGWVAWRHRSGGPLDADPDREDATDSGPDRP